MFSSPAVSPSPSSQSLLSNSSTDTDNWTTSYKIPWSKMSQNLQDSTKNKERPFPADRREMIRVVVDDIVKICRKPTRRQLVVIAAKFVEDYPQSFEDKLEDMVIGTGYNSILSQLEQRFANTNRPMLQSKRNSSSPDRKKKHSCSYGTKEFQPELPSDENEESQEARRLALKEIHSQEIWNTALVVK